MADKTEEELEAEIERRVAERLAAGKPVTAPVAHDPALREMCTCTPCLALRAAAEAATNASLATLPPCRRCGKGRELHDGKGRFEWTHRSRVPLREDGVCKEYSDTDGRGPSFWGSVLDNNLKVLHAAGVWSNGAPNLPSLTPEEERRVRDSDGTLERPLVPQFNTRGEVVMSRGERVAVAAAADRRNMLARMSRKGREDFLRQEEEDNRLAAERLFERGTAAPRVIPDEPAAGVKYVPPPPETQEGRDARAAKARTQEFDDWAKRGRLLEIDDPKKEE